MTAACSLASLVCLLMASVALAQSKVDVASAVMIDAKMTPYRPFWLYPPLADDLELTFTIDESSADFSSFLFQCDYLGKDHQKSGGSVWSLVTRSQFKPSSDGRLVARTLPTRIPAAA